MICLHPSTHSIQGISGTFPQQQPTPHPKPGVRVPIQTRSRRTPRSKANNRDWRRTPECVAGARGPRRVPPTAAPPPSSHLPHTHAHHARTHKPITPDKSAQRTTTVPPGAHNLRARVPGCMATLAATARKAIAGVSGSTTARRAEICLALMGANGYRRISASVYSPNRSTAIEHTHRRERDISSRVPPGWCSGAPGKSRSVTSRRTTRVRSRSGMANGRQSATRRTSRASACVPGIRYTQSVRVRHTLIHTQATGCNTPLCSERTK